MKSFELNTPTGTDSIKTKNGLAHWNGLLPQLLTRVSLIRTVLRGGMSREMKQLQNAVS